MKTIYHRGIISYERTSVALSGLGDLVHSDPGVYALASLRASPLANFCRAFSAG